MAPALARAGTASAAGSYQMITAGTRLQDLSVLTLPQWPPRDPKQSGWIKHGHSPKGGGITHSGSSGLYTVL